MNSAENMYRRSPGWIQTVLLNAHAWRIDRHRYGPTYRSMVQMLRAMEGWSPERIRDYQNARLRAIVDLAYARSPFYRQRMEQVGVRPSDIRDVTDLPRLPLLTKPELRGAAESAQTSPRPRRGWHHGHTSGTTGSPLGLWYDRATCQITNAVDRQQKIWAGMRDGDWIGVLLGRVIVPPTQTGAPFWRVNALQRQVWFSSFHMSDDTLGSYVAEIRRRRISVLEGYPSTLYVLAQFLLRQGLTLPMRALISSSETLHPVQRETIEATFCCPLSDFYALAERVIYAAECEYHDGKHLIEPYGFTEVVDDDGNPVPDGSPGYLVGTSLHNTAVPLVRYRTGDVSAIRIDPCGCGRTWRRIENVTTKAEDIVITPGGRMISPSVLTHPFKPLKHITASQIVQDRLDHILVRVVPTTSFPEAERDSLVRSMRERVGEGVEIEVQAVAHIPRDPSGKFRWVISRVPHSYSLDWSGLRPDLAGQYFDNGTGRPAGGAAVRSRTTE